MSLLDWSSLSSAGKEAWGSMGRVLQDSMLPFFLLVVDMSTTVEGGLFPEEQTRLKLTEAMDAGNNRHGDFTVMYGSLLNQESKGSHVISPAWRPDGIRNVAVQ